MLWRAFCVYRGKKKFISSYLCIGIHEIYKVFQQIYVFLFKTSQKVNEFLFSSATKPAAHIVLIISIFFIRSNIELYIHARFVSSTAYEPNETT